MSNSYKEQIYLDSLKFHERNRPGKLYTGLSKALTNQRDLSLAYSPGVAAPCIEIEQNPAKAYDYTIKGNCVAVISNGTAVLGLGNLGALASKPVMEGKAVLFKRFADIDATDLEIDSTNTEEIINAIKCFAPTWGGINLEDIKAPDCFIIEQRLKDELDIPVFHDDQHGTAIITIAGLLNACDLTKRKLKDIKMVVSGAGAAAIACIELAKSMGVRHENVILCDSKGVIYKGRTDGMNPWKEKHAVDTNLRTIEEALVGADVFLGVSVKNAVSQKMVKSMAAKPIIFACANPDPEILPQDVKEVCPDAIIATGRSDYNNQVNNIMGFPYIFRGALDVRASAINDEMKIAAVKAIASLAKEPVPEEVYSAYSHRKLSFSPEYIIPVPFDPRLIEVIPMAVAKAAMESGVARKPITDFKAYAKQLRERLNPANNFMGILFEKLRNHPRRVLFSEGEEENVIKAAIQWQQHGYGTPVLVGYEDKIREVLASLDHNGHGIEITNAALHPNIEQYIADLYAKLQRKGYLYRDCARLIKRDRHVFSTMMLENNEADAMVTGLTKAYLETLDDVVKVIEPPKDSAVFGLSVLLQGGRTIFIADTTIHELPDAQEMVDIAIKTAAEAKAMGYEPRVAFLSFSNFGNPMREKADKIREAVKILDGMKVDFEYDGEMSADVALNERRLKDYPFARLSGTANILIMPGLHSANISSKLLKEIGGGTLIGPILCGLNRPIQILPMGSGVSDILNMAAISAVRDIEE